MAQIKNDIQYVVYIKDLKIKVSSTEAKILPTTNHLFAVLILNIFGKAALSGHVGANTICITYFIKSCSLAFLLFEQLHLLYGCICLEDL